MDERLTGDCAPTRIPMHTSLTKRPFLLGVGVEPLAAALTLILVALNIAGPLSYLMLAAALLAALLLWGAKRWLRTDDYAIECLVAGLTQPSAYEAHPHVEDKPIKPKPAIPKRFVN